MDEIQMLSKLYPPPDLLSPAFYNINGKQNDKEIDFLVDTVDQIQNTIKISTQNLFEVNSSLETMKKKLQIFKKLKDHTKNPLNCIRSFNGAVPTEITGNGSDISIPNNSNTSEMRQSFVMPAFSIYNQSFNNLDTPSNSNIRRDLDHFYGKSLEKEPQNSDEIDYPRSTKAVYLISDESEDEFSRDNEANSLKFGWEKRNLFAGIDKETDYQLSYKKFDSYWTLKYTSESENVRELIKNSGIYVNKKFLTNALKYNYKQTTLARALMDGVFKKEALSSCTIRGKSGNRPGLYQVGVETILTFVENFAKAQNWKFMQRQNILISLSRKMTETRNVKIIENFKKRL